MNINWPVFQAAASLLAGDVASKAPQASLQTLIEFSDARFVHLYRSLERVAQRIEAGEGADPSQSETQT